MKADSSLAKILTIILAILIVVGLAILSSAGVIEGQKKFDSSYYYPLHQLLFGVLPGIILFVICSRIPHKYWKQFALPILLLAICLMVLVFAPGIGLSIKGAHRWLHLGPITFQPSEFLKLALIMYLAAWFSGRERAVGHLSYSIVPLLLVLGFIALLLILQPDLGTLSILVVIALALYFFAGARLSHFVGLILIFAVLMGIFALVAPYRLNRIKAFWDRSADRQGVSYHINQALVGIGSGGVFGLGFGQSKQKLNYLPEPVGDSIFAIVVEELGLVGAGVLLLLFTSMTLILITIAYQTHDPFSRLFTLGIAVWLFGQTLINIASITGLIPLTGLPLPFTSYGSSALAALMAGLGIVHNIAQ